MQSLQPGIKHTSAVAVTSENTAEALGSGSLPVFATPAMTALMENAAAAAVQPYLDEDSTSVGTQLSVAHTAATPVGMTVRAEAELIAICKRRLTFKVTAYDDAEQIGAGTHERFIVKKERFLQKGAEKAALC